MKKAELIARLAQDGFSENIIRAFAEVPREDFVLPEFQSVAYNDTALPIGYGQTISQPYTIAFMLDLLRPEPGQKILEVGSGSGYVLALLDSLAPGSRIFGTELVPGLVSRSKLSLRRRKNIKVSRATRDLGLPSEAPFDRILVSASARELPDALVKQLGPEGIMVCPVGDSIWKITHRQGTESIERFEGFVFVPLVRRDLAS